MPSEPLYKTVEKLLEKLSILTSAGYKVEDIKDFRDAYFGLPDKLVELTRGYIPKALKIIKEYGEKAERKLNEPVPIKISPEALEKIHKKTIEDLKSGKIRIPPP